MEHKVELHLCSLVPKKANPAISHSFQYIVQEITLKPYDFKDI